MNFYIISDKCFPHGDSGGNRIEYVCKCFIYEGITPFVISFGKNNNDEYEDKRKCYIHNGINYYNSKSYDGIKKFIFRYLLSGISCAKVYKKYRKDTTENTKILIYSSNPIFINQIKYELRHYNCDLFFDVVEWDDETSFKYKKYDFRYWLFRYSFDVLFPSGKGVVSISKNIHAHFSKMNVPSCIHPICLDSSDFQLDKNCSYNKDYSKIKYIYPGFPGNKDDIVTVLKAFNSLTDSEKSKIEFHFTLVTKNQIMKILGKDKNIIDDLKDVIIFHSWLDYDKLIELYHEMDSLFLFRKNNLITLSNFPSKLPELLSCGVIVTANNQGDFYNYLTDGCDCICISQYSIDGCVNAIRKLLSMNENERKVMSNNARKCAKEKFDYRLFSKEIVNFIMNT